MTDWNPVWGTGDQGDIASTFVDQLPSRRKPLTQNTSMKNLWNAASDAHEAIGAARRNANNPSPYGDSGMVYDDPSAAGPRAVDPYGVQAIVRAQQAGGGVPHVNTGTPPSVRGPDADWGSGQPSQMVPYSQRPNPSLAPSMARSLASAPDGQPLAQTVTRALEMQRGGDGDPTTMLGNSIGRGDPSSELAQPGDPGYAAANPVFRPPPSVPGQRNAGPQNVANNVAQQVIQQAAQRAAQGDPRASDAVAQIAWQREAAANGNPAGDTSAPQAYIDSWNGMRAAGQDTGPLGSMLTQATQATLAQRAASDAQQQATQRALILQQAPAATGVANAAINRALQSSAPPTPGEPGGPPLTNQYPVYQPPMANGAPKVNQATGEPTGFTYRGQPINASDLVYRGQPISPDDLVYRGQAPQRTNYSAATDMSPVDAAMSAARAPAPAINPSTGEPTGLAPSGAAPKPEGDFHAYARAVAQRYGVDPDIFERQITQESGWKPNAHSNVGARGLGQFMPATAKDYGVDVNDPYSSLDGAARYMADNLKRNKGNYRLALAAYNAGQGNVDKYGEGVFEPDFAHGQTRDYVNIIMGKQ